MYTFNPSPMPMGSAAVPAAQPAGVIAGPVVVEAAFLVLLLAGVAVAFPAHFACAAAGAVAGVAVGVVFLIADDVRGCVQFQRCGAEVIVELVALHGRGGRDTVPVFHGQGFDYCNAFLVVHDVQGLALGLERPVHGLAPDLEPAEVQAGLRHAIFHYNLASPYPVAVVAVVRLRRAARDVAQPFGEVPVHRTQVRHGRHGTVSVVGEARRGAPDRGTCQAVAVRGVGVRAGPRVAVGVVDYRQDIPDAVIFPFAGIVPHGGAVLRADLRGVVALSLGLAVGVHGGVLAAGGLYQPVEGVVFELLVRAHDASVEEYRLLGVVVYLRDVARGVVGVVEVLQDVRAVVARGQEAFHAEGFIVIRVAGRRAVAILDSLALALRIVVDVLNKVRGGSGSAQFDIYRFQQRSLVVRR